MTQGKTAIYGLRAISGLVILVGLAGVVGGLLERQTIPLFVFDVPTWVLGASAIYMGLRYWRRIPEMERVVKLSPGFSLSNFTRPKP